MTQSHPLAKIFSGSLLVAGTAIGAGMLALPIATAFGGFWPAVAICFLCWVFMAATGLLLLEVCLWLPQDANMVSMARDLLGKPGKMISWALYLFLFYCLTIAYVAGGGGFVGAVFGGALSPWLSTLLFTAIFSPFVYLGTRAVDRFNLILMLGLGVSYFVFILVGFKHVEVPLLTAAHWPAAALAMPVIFTSFSFQGIVPSLTSYFKRDAALIRKAIIFGTSIPFIIYVIWEFLILGIVPLEGPGGLREAHMQGVSAVIPLKDALKSPWVYAVGQTFAFFALTTSFLGVTLGLVDFLADGLKMAKVGLNKVLLCVVVFLPPTLIAMFNPGIFIKALTYAGGIGCALLLGLLPIVMVFVGRYRKHYGTRLSQLPGGRPMLFFLFCFVLFELIVEAINEMVF
ncbi:MAG: amino acid permease [Anaerolineae bacterium]